MERLVNLVTDLHQSTPRKYFERMANNKVPCMDRAQKFSFDYWDGERKYGYGGYKYDGRWRSVAARIIDYYKLPPNAKILDVGCGKGHLLYELTQLQPDFQIQGFDISHHALDNAKSEIKAHLFFHPAEKTYPFADQNFDLVLSLNTLHNLQIFDLKKALNEIERVGKNKFLVVESYRNNLELFNLQCWALTCRSFFTTQEWKWLFDQHNYTGNYEFIFFE